MARGGVGTGIGNGGSTAAAAVAASDSGLGDLGDLGDFGAAYARLVEARGEDGVRRMLEGLGGLISAPSVLGFQATGKLRGAEKAAFQAAAGSYLDRVREQEAYCESLSGEMPPFDLLSPYHRTCLVADLCVGLLVPAVPLPAETIEHHCAFQAMFIHLMEQIEVEIDMDCNDDWAPSSAATLPPPSPPLPSPAQWLSPPPPPQPLPQTSPRNSSTSLPQTLPRNSSASPPPAENVFCPGPYARAAEELVRRGGACQIEERRRNRKVRAQLATSRKEKGFAEMTDVESTLDVESELQRLTRMMENRFLDDVDEEEDGVGERGDSGEVVEDHVDPGGGGDSASSRGKLAFGENATRDQTLAPSPGVVTQPTKAEGGRAERNEAIAKDTHGCRDSSCRGDDHASDEVANHYRYYWRTLLHEMILERHAANPLLNGSGASELHVAAQSTVCPPKTCADVERWGHAHRMVLGAGFHVEQHEAYLCNGRLEREAVAAGVPDEVRRFDVVSRRVEQRSREFARHWTPEKSLLSFRTIDVLSDDDSVSQCFGSSGDGSLLMAKLSEIEKLLLERKVLTGQDSLFVSDAAKHLWRRRFLKQMEGKQWSSLNARLKALKRVMDSERAAGLHELVWPFHSFESEFGVVNSHAEWLEHAERYRPWSKKLKGRPSMCSLCYKSAEDGQKFPVCAKCRLAEYCCREHQRDDWVTHKAFCKIWTKQAKEAAASQASSANKATTLASS